jgi:ActR/RegA family two-component response regulator
MVEGFSVTLRGLQYLQAQRILKRCGGDFAAAARVLGVRRTTLYRYLDRLDLLRTRN